MYVFDFEESGSGVLELGARGGGLCILKVERIRFERGFLRVFFLREFWCFVFFFSIIDERFF